MLAAAIRGLAFAQVSIAEKEFFFAQKLYEDGLHLLAAKQFRDFAQKFPNNERADQALFLSGESYFAISEYDKAFGAYRDMELNYPRSALMPQSRFKMGQCQLAQENFKAAAELWSRVAYFHRESELAPRALLAAGGAYDKAGDFGSALDSFLRVVSDYPDALERMDAHLAVVNLYVDRGDFQEAIAQMDGIFHALGPDLKDPRIYWLRGQIFEKLGQFREAEANYKKIVNEFKSSKEAENALYHLALAYQRHGDYTNALAQFDAFIAQADNADRRAAAYLGRGEIFETLTDNATALDSYRQASRIASAALVDKANLKLARLLAKIKRYQEADKALSGIIKVDPGTDVQRDTAGIIQPAYLLQVDILVELGRARDALSLIRTYKNRFRGSEIMPEMSFRQAEIVEQATGNYPMALRAYQDFIDTYPGNARVDNAQLGLGRCYEKSGEYRLAIREYQHYLETYPGADEFSWAQGRVRSIRENLNLDSNSSLRGLTSLVAVLNSESPSKNIDLEIGKIYYQAKSFEDAVGLFKRAIEMLQEGNNGKSPAEAFFLLGKSYFRLAELALLADDPVGAKSLFDSVVVSLSYLEQNFSEFKAEEVKFLLTRVHLLTNEGQMSLLDLAATWLERYPQGKHLDFIQMAFADSIFESASAADTSAFRNARTYYEEVVSTPRSSIYLEKAAFRSILCRARFEPDSLVLASVSQFVGDNPRSHFIPEALYLRAQIFQRMGSSQSALDDLRRIETDFFYSSIVTAAQILLGDINSDLGKHQPALESYMKVRRHLKSTSAMELDSLTIRIANTYEQLGQKESALREYIRFIHGHAEDDEAVQAMLAVARISQQEGYEVLAREYLSSILNRDLGQGLKARVHSQLGDLLFADKSFPQALTHYLAAKQLAQDRVEQRYAESRAIRCQYKMEQFAAANAAEKAFKKKYKNIKEEEGQFLLDKGNAYLDDKNFILAEKTFKKLRGSFKNTDWGAHGEFGLGAVYLITNHTEDALKILTDIPSRYPDSEVTPLAYFNLGDFYYKSQQVENAIHAFKRILKHPKAGDYYPKALLYLSKCYGDARMWDQAIAVTREYLNKYPRGEHVFALKVALGRHLMNLKEYDRAIGHFRDLLPYADTESKAEIQFNVAQCYKEMGNFERATAEYLKVKYLTPRTKLPWHVTALFETGRCFLRLNEVEQARKIFQRILREQGVGSNFGRFALKQLEEIDKSYLSESTR